MATYVDGFVVPVPKKKIDAYKRMARKAGKIWREHGALEYIECVADDVKPGKDLVPAGGEAQARRGRGVLVDRLQVARATRDRINQGDEGPAAGRHDGPEEAALRRQADDLRRLQADDQSLSAHAAIASSTSARTSASRAALRAGTWKEWSASSNTSSVARAAERLHQRPQQSRSASSSRVPCRNSIGTRTSARCARALVRGLPARMQRKAEEGEPAHAGQRRGRLRLRSHAAAERFAAGDQRRRRAARAPLRRPRRAPRRARRAGVSGRFEPCSMYGNW